MILQPKSFEYWTLTLMTAIKKVSSPMKNSVCDQLQAHFNGKFSECQINLLLPLQQYNTLLSCLYIHKLVMFHIQYTSYIGMATYYFWQKFWASTRTIILHRSSAFNHIFTAAFVSGEHWGFSLCTHTCPTQQFHMIKCPFSFGLKLYTVVHENVMLWMCWSKQQVCLFWEKHNKWCVISPGSSGKSINGKW